MYYEDPAQPLAPAGDELDDLDHDLSDLLVRRVKPLESVTFTLILYIFSPVCT